MVDARGSCLYLCTIKRIDSAGDSSEMEGKLTSKPSLDFPSKGFSVPMLLIKPCSGRLRALNSSAQSCIFLLAGKVLQTVRL